MRERGREHLSSSIYFVACFCSIAKLTGNVSFYEIWVLLYNTNGIDMVGIRRALTELGVEDVKENSTKWQTYSALCKWKDRTTLGDQAKLIRDAFYKARYEEAWKIIG